MRDREKQYQWARRNREKVLATQRKWYAANVEERRAYAKKYKAMNVENVKKWKHSDYVKNRDRISRYCRSKHLKDRYGLTTEKFDDLLRKQHHCCAICREPFTKNPHVDHCHVTGYVRALLCCSCNAAIGFMKHNHLVALSAANYLSKEVLFNHA